MATVSQDVDNPFFKFTTAEWPFRRLVELTTDARLVDKPTLSVLYEEGEIVRRVVSAGLTGTPAGASETGDGVRNMADGGMITGLDNKSRGQVVGDSVRARQGLHGEGHEGMGTVGAFLVMRGSVDLHVLER